MKTTDVTPLDTVYTIGDNGQGVRGVVVTTDRHILDGVPANTVSRASTTRGRGGWVVVRTLRESLHIMHGIPLPDDGTLRSAARELAALLASLAGQQASLPDLPAGVHLAVVQPSQVWCTWAEFLAEKEAAEAEWDARQGRTATENTKG